MRKRFFKFLFIFALLFGFTSILASCNDAKQETPIDNTDDTDKDKDKEKENDPSNPAGPSSTDPATPDPSDPVGPTDPVDPTPDPNADILSSLPEDFYNVLISSDSGIAVNFEQIKIKSGDTDVTIYDDSYVKLAIVDETLVGDIYIYAKGTDSGRTSEQKVYVSITDEGLYLATIEDSDPRFDEVYIYDNVDFIDYDDLHYEFGRSLGITFNQKGLIHMILNVISLGTPYYSGSNEHKTEIVESNAERAAMIVAMLEATKPENVKTYFDPKNPARLTEIDVETIAAIISMFNKDLTLDQVDEAFEIVLSYVGQVAAIAELPENAIPTSNDIALGLLEVLGIDETALSDELKAKVTNEELLISDVLTLDAVKALTINNLVYRALVFMNGLAPEEEQVQLPSQDEYDVAEYIYAYLEDLIEAEKQAEEYRKQAYAYSLEALCSFLVDYTFDHNEVKGTFTTDYLKTANLVLSRIKLTDCIDTIAGKQGTYERLVNFFNPENYDDENKKFVDLTLAEVFDSYAGEGSFEKLLSQFAPVAEGEESTRFIDLTIADLYNMQFATKDNPDAYAQLIDMFNPSLETSIPNMTLGGLIEAVSTYYPNITSEMLEEKIEQILEFVLTIPQVEEYAEYISQDTLVFMAAQALEINEELLTEEMTIVQFFQLEEVQAVTVNELVQKVTGYIISLTSETDDEAEVPNPFELAYIVLTTAGNMTINDVMSQLLSMIVPSDELGVEFDEMVYTYLSFAQEMTVNDVIAMLLAQTPLANMIDFEDFDAYAYVYMGLKAIEKTTIYDAIGMAFNTTGAEIFKTINDALDTFNENCNIYFLADNEGNFKSCTVELSFEVVSGKITVTPLVDFEASVNEKITTIISHNRKSDSESTKVVEEIFNDNIFDLINENEDGYTFEVIKEDDKIVGFKETYVDEDVTTVTRYLFGEGYCYTGDYNIYYYSSKEYLFDSIWSLDVELKSISKVGDEPETEYYGEFYWYFDEDTKKILAYDPDYTETVIQEGDGCKAPKVTKCTSEDYAEDYYYKVEYTGHKMESAYIVEKDNGYYDVYIVCSECGETYLYAENQSGDEYFMEKEEVIFGIKFDNTLELVNDNTYYYLGENDVQLTDVSVEKNVLDGYDFVNYYAKKSETGYTFIFLINYVNGDSHSTGLVVLDAEGQICGSYGSAQVAEPIAISEGLAE